MRSREPHSTQHRAHQSDAAGTASVRLLRATLRALGLVALAMLLGDVSASPADAQSCNLTGTWRIDVGLGNGPVILVDDGSGTLTGVGELAGSAFTVANGTYAEPAVAFDLSGSPLPLRFTGNLTSCDLVEGQLLNGGSPFLSATITRQRSTYCGDGTRQLDEGEQCDDGNFLDGDGCSSKCVLTSCGNGSVDLYEECDQGAGNAADSACLPSCSWATCGDGVRLTGAIPPGAPVTPEACDAGVGNTNLPNAVCRPDCTTPSCGDGVRDDSIGERCDEGPAMPSATCDATCNVPGLAHGVEFALTDLSTTLGFTGFVNYVNLNELGQIAGYFDNDGPNNAFFWDGTRVVVVPPTNPDGESYAFAVNEVGQFAGGLSVLPSHQEHAFVWSSGTVTDLHPPAGLSSYAYDINRSGHVVGSIVYGPSSAGAFLWDGVTLHDLGTYPGGTLASAVAINDRGDVALTGNVPPLLQSRSLLLRDGAWTDLGTLGGESSNSWSMSNAGHVVGDSRRLDDSGRGFLYAGGPLIDLGVLGGNRSSARAVNSAGQVVGFSTVAGGGGADHAFLYDCRGMTDLNDLIAPGSKYLLDISDWRINDAGQIAGIAVDSITGEDRAVLLDPLPFCGNCRVTQASGEQCDDGNTVGGDGCSATCQLEATAPVSGTGSASTGTTATPSQPAQAAVTSPSGGTVTIARTTTGADPTGLDVLGVRFVIDAPAATVESPLVLDFRLDASFLPPGIALDDVQIVRDGAIAGPCTGSTPYTAATPDPCVASRTLVTGGNILIRTLSSHASEWAFASEVCPSTPDPTCATPTKAGKSVLLIKGGASADKHSLVWTWASGPATSSTDFGNPRGAGRITACLYDASSGSPRLTQALEVPAGGQCGKKPCWKGTKKGFDYTDASARADGVGKVTLLAGAAGKSKIVLRAKGTAVAIPALPLAAPVTLQLRTAADRCFGATFSTPAPAKDPALQFKAKSD
jgi:cysteine-rich repeat protein/probable HAF family extracellular repeat protein